MGLYRRRRGKRRQPRNDCSEKRRHFPNRPESGAERDPFSPSRPCQLRFRSGDLAAAGGKERIFILASSEEAGCIEQTGFIQALAVELKSSSNPYAKAVQHSGVIEATALEERGGEVFLVAEKGICEVSGNVTARKGEREAKSASWETRCMFAKEP